jgi:hypothetical protein
MQNMNPTTLLLIELVAYLFFSICNYKLFTKAGRPGWAAFVPIYSTIVALDIAGKPAWWIVLMLIPLVNLIVGIIFLVAFIGAYGKGGGYVLGTLLLPVIFLPMLAFGGSQYQGAAR